MLSIVFALSCMLVTGERKENSATFCATFLRHSWSAFRWLVLSLLLSYSDYIIENIISKNARFCVRVSEDNVASLEHLDTEILWNLKLLSEVITQHSPVACMFSRTPAMVTSFCCR